MTKIIITGSSGYLGSHLCRFFDDAKVFAFYKENKPPESKVEPVQVDLLNTEELNILFKEIKPDYVIHLAGIIPSQISKYDEKIVFEMNVELTKQIASLSHTYNSLLIFTSSDLVYDEGDDIKENHPLKPQNLYAQTKLEAEKATNKYGKYYLILRTALMYGFSISPHKSFFDFAFKELLNGNEIKAFYDQYRNPLFVEDAAKFLIAFTKIKLPDQFIMNFCGFEKLSRYQMVLKTAEVFELNKDLVQKVSCESFMDYKMPKNIGLNFELMKKFELHPAPFVKNLEYLKTNFEFYKPYIFPETIK